MRKARSLYSYNNFFHKIYKLNFVSITTKRKKLKMLKRPEYEPDQLNFARKNAHELANKVINGDPKPIWTDRNKLPYLPLLDKPHPIVGRSGPSVSVDSGVYENYVPPRGLVEEHLTLRVRLMQAILGTAQTEVKTRTWGNLLTEFMNTYNQDIEAALAARKLQEGGLAEQVRTA